MADLAVVATISHAKTGVSIDLCPDMSVDIGRASTCAISIGNGQRPDDPLDLGVSRLAMTVGTRGQRVYVRNRSGSNPVCVQPRVGPTVTIEPGDNEVSLASPHLVLTLRGRGTFSHDVRVAVHASEPSWTPLVTDDPPTLVGAVLKPRERRTLGALALPLLREKGHRAVPSSYEEAAKVLGVRRDTVREVVKNLRARLEDQNVSLVDGAEDPKDALVRWAVRSRVISDVDVDAVAPR